MGVVGIIMTALPVTALTLWLTWYVSTSVISYRRLRHIPGPTIAALTSWWWIRAAVSGEGYLALADVCTRYGDIARIGPNTVVTCDADLIRKMNALRGSTYTRGKWYKAFKLDAQRENLFTELDEEKHANMRARISPGYSGKDNPKLESSVNDIIMNMVQLIQRKYLTTGSKFKPMDFAEMAQYPTLDVITFLSLGEPFGFISEDTDKYGYVKAIEENFPVMNLFSAVPLLSAIMRIPTVQNNLIPTVKDKTGLGRAKAVAQAIITKRFTDEKINRHDMVISFKNAGLTRDEIADESLFQLLAGSDTTATIIRTGFLSIMTNHQIYAKLQTEISTIDIPLATVISNRQALKLPYLQATVKEALRHHPAVTGLLPRVVGPNGDTHNGVYFPPGMEVAFCAWNIHRTNTKVYGDDAAIFRPERWLEASPERLALMQEAFHLVFGYGRNRCMGENIARLELNKVFFEIFRRFDWSIIDPVKPFEKNVSYVLFVQKGMWVKVMERGELDSVDA